MRSAATEHNAGLRAHTAVCGSVAGGGVSVQTYDLSRENLDPVALVPGVRVCEVDNIGAGPQDHLLVSGGASGGAYRPGADPTISSLDVTTSESGKIASLKSVRCPGRIRTVRRTSPRGLTNNSSCRPAVSISCTVVG